MNAAKKAHLSRADNLRGRAAALPASDPARRELEREAMHAESRARSVRSARERKRDVSTVLASCPRGCSTRCREGVADDAHTR